MTSPTPAPPEPTRAPKQAQLAENRAQVDRAQLRRRAQAAPPQPSKAVTLEDRILEVSDDLLRVSAGFQSVLTLLDLQAGDVPDSIGLHALLSPLTRQIDQCADRLQALV